jgi:hypothetical protein
MKPVVHALLAFVVSWFRSRLSLQLETVALRHQLAVYQSSIRRPRIRPTDRILWSWLSRHWSAWRAALIFVRPTTVTAWQRKRFRDHWSKLSRRSKPGRPSVPQEVIALIRKISSANAHWGSSRIVGKLKKLGIKVAKCAVEKYRFATANRPPPLGRRS